MRLIKFVDVECFNDTSACRSRVRVEPRRTVGALVISGKVYFQIFIVSSNFSFSELFILEISAIKALSKAVGA